VADLADFLLRSGARVVCFDLVVTTPSVPAEDQALLATVRRWSAARPGALRFASLAMPADKDGSGRYVLLPPCAPELGGLGGCANGAFGGDGVVRRLVPVRPAAGGGRLPALSLTVLAASAGVSGQALDERLGADHGTIPLPLRDESGKIAGIAETPVA